MKFRTLLTAVLAGVLMACLCLPVAAQNYYDPDMSGHGISLHHSDAGDFVALWFTYSPTGDQAWFITDAHDLGEEVDLYAPSALFPSRLFDAGEPVGHLTITPTNHGIDVQYGIRLWKWNCDGQPRPGPHPPYCRGSTQMVLLAH